MQNNRYQFYFKCYAQENENLYESDNMRNGITSLMIQNGCHFQNMLLSLVIHKIYLQEKNIVCYLPVEDNGKENSSGPVES